MNIELGSFIGILGVLVGAIVTWVVTHIYYLKASKSLIKESQELRNLSELVIQVLLATNKNEILIPKRREDGRWTIHKYIGASPPKDAYDEWNKHIQGIQTD